MSDMHHTLQLELHIALNRKLIKNIPMFKAISDSDCLIDLIEKLEPKIFIPGEYICLQGELGREMYIIVRGQVQVLLGESRVSVATLQDGDVFGEQALITRTKRNASIRSLTYVESLVLRKEGFETVSQRYPQFFRSLQIVATKGKGGWASVRATLKMARSVRLFGGEINLEDLLMGVRESSPQLKHSSMRGRRINIKKARSRASSGASRAGGSRADASRSGGSYLGHANGSRAEI